MTVLALPSRGQPPPPGGRPLREVGRRSDLRVRSHRDTAHGDSAPGGARHPDVDGVGPEAAGVLEEVVLGPRGGLPGAPAVGADLELGDRLVGVDNLHAEPVRARAGLVVQDDGRRDAAGHLGVRGGDLARRRGPKLLEGVLEEVQVAFVALGTLVDDLGDRFRAWFKRGVIKVGVWSRRG